MSAVFTRVVGYDFSCPFCGDKSATASVVVYPELDDYKAELECRRCARVVASSFDSSADEALERLTEGLEMTRAFRRVP